MTEPLPPVAVLLKEARGAYGTAIHREVAARGYDPLPPNGAFVLGALHWGSPREDIMRERGRGLERGQTIAILQDRGYLIDDDEGLRLTDLGHECAHAIFDATSDVTDQVRVALGDEGFSTFIRGLVALIEFKEAAEER